MGDIGCFGTQITQITQNTQIHFVSAESARSAWEICGVLARRLRRIRRLFLYLRNLRDLREKYRVFWHADYADSFCFCGICENGVENRWSFGTQITQNTRIVSVSAESARSAWEI